LNDRKINYLFIFTAIALFVLEAGVLERYAVLLALLLAVLISIVAFFLRLLTIDGMRAAMVTGTLVFGFGGLEPTMALLFFFLSSNVIGLLFLKRKPLVSDYRTHSRRNGEQVWANALWFVLFVVLWFFAKADMFLIAALSAVAAATSDTWGTEVGTRFANSKTVLITSLKQVQTGTDGGVSIPGSIATVLGALGVASILLFFPKNFMIISFLSVATAGIFGGILDSILGAYYQTGKRKLYPFISSSVNHENNTVNFLATGLAAVFGLIMYNLLIYVLV
jgi:uncharacterized protein (TIGR00297 family)